MSRSRCNRKPRRNGRPFSTPAPTLFVMLDISEIQPRTVHAVLLDDSKLVVGEVGEVERLQVVVELPGRARSDKCRGDCRLPQHPLQRKLRQGLTTCLGQLVQL